MSLHPSTAFERPAYPRHQWYVGALSSEVGAGLFSRTLLGEPIIMYRSASGRVYAADGICPHRGYPLALGTLGAQGIQCAYHGLSFAAFEPCRAVGREGAGAERALRRYAVVEQAPLIWIWTGEPGAADPAAIPATADLGIGDDAWRVESCGYLRVAARHRFLCDNLLDTAHITSIHNGSLERAPLHFEALPNDPDPRRVVHVRESRANDAAAFTFLLPDARGPIDVVLTSDFRAPGLIVAVSTDFYQTASAGRPRTPIANMAFVHAITPESATSTHYFPLFARNFRIADELLSRTINARNAVVAAEDKAVVETLETTAGRFVRGGVAGFSIPADELAVRAQQLIASLIEAG